MKYDVQNLSLHLLIYINLINCLLILRPSIGKGLIRSLHIGPITFRSLADLVQVDTHTELMSYEYYHLSVSFPLTNLNRPLLLKGLAEDLNYI
jgi:hypothetical protein